MHNQDIVSKIIRKLTVTDTRQLKIQGTIVINIHKTPVMTMLITAITGSIAGMKMVIIEARIELMKGEINIAIPKIMINGDLKNILIETITGTVHFIEGLIMVTEINHSSQIDPAIAGFVVS